MRPRSQPVLFAIDDDVGVVAALQDDLTRRFGRDFRVIGQASAAAGLATPAGWAKDDQAGFALFRVSGRVQDRGTYELRELLTRFGVPFTFHAAYDRRGRRLLASRGLDASRLPVVIRHDDYTMVQPTPAQV